MRVVVKQPIVDHCGQTFASVSDLGVWYGVNATTFRLRRKRGLPMRECLREAGAVYFKDNTGVEHTSARSVCEKYGIARTLFFELRKTGYTVEQIIEMAGDSVCVSII